MRNINMDIDELVHIMGSISHYKKLPIVFTQLDPKQREPLNKFWKEKILQPGKSYFTPNEGEMWNDISLHVVSQKWSSTSCGWGGIGGASITNSYTTIIENNNFKFACIYYNGELAYICEINEEYNNLKYNNLPGLPTCRKKLSVIYAKTR
jgi:hypothetical protein